MFQHTAARRRLPRAKAIEPSSFTVSTHSRPKAAANIAHKIRAIWIVSTHSRPKAAAFISTYLSGHQTSFNTQPPEGGCVKVATISQEALAFQHTAARRRLRLYQRICQVTKQVSTHSRPKAAAWFILYLAPHQILFQHTAARRRLRKKFLYRKSNN